MTASQAGTYTATYTNASGCKSTQKFMLAVNTTASLLTLHAKGSIGSEQIQLFKSNNPNVQLFDGRSELRIFNLKGGVRVQPSPLGKRAVHPQPEAGRVCG
ncbi:MAG: hypothetical protein IPN71_19015 [Fibrobacteres bacterium]|nr:hypothetical protein [Fibrobacterota bacterium]